MGESIEKLDVDVNNNDDDEPFIRPIIRRQKTLKTKRLKISIPSLASSSAQCDGKETPRPVGIGGSLPECEDSGSLDDNALAFFSETHEDQEPEYIAYHEQLKEKEIQQKIRALDITEQEGRKEIEAVLTKQFQDKHAEAERSLEKYKERAANEEKMNIERLEQIYRQKSAGNTKKISESMEAVRRRNREEMNNSMAQHRQQSLQRRLSEAQSNAEWSETSQRIQMKHNNMMEDLRQKSEELKKKLEQDFQRDKEKIQKTSRDKLEEADSSKQKIRQKLASQLLQLRQRYLNRHLQKLAQEREDLLADSPSKKKELAELQSVMSAEGDAPKSTLEEHAELKPPSPIQSKPAWAEELLATCGAALRHKNRKAVMSQTARQLSIEIHNEGIWISSVASDSDDNSKAGRTYDQEFVAWGQMAFSILDSLVCGEVPPGCDRFLEKNASAAEMAASNGGQVRCSILDMRTSDATAAQMRAAASKELQDNLLNDLEAKVAQLNTKIADLETEQRKYEQLGKEQTTQALSAEQKVKNAVQYQEDFKKKFKQYLGPDGTPKSSTQPSDREKLSKALSNYKGQVDQATRELKARKQVCTDLKLKAQKVQQDVKAAQKECMNAAALLKRKKAIALAKSGENAKNARIVEALENERAATRVEDVVAALKKTAARRRDQVEEKKTTNVNSAWIQSFQVPNVLRKSLFHRLHRRKHHVILRPTPESFLNEIRSDVTYAVARKFSGRSNSAKMAAIETEVLKAEATYLSVLHPFSETKLPSIPHTKNSMYTSHSSTWAEPGWLLNLEVPEDDDADMILPRAKSYLVETNLAEIASAPGRQASSLLRSARLQCLTSSLSRLATASAPAEVSASPNVSAAQLAEDPMHASTADVAQGYRFALKPPTSPARRKSTTKPQTDSTADVDTTAKRPAAEMATNSAQTSKSTPDQNKPEPKRRRSSKKTAQTTPSPRNQKPMNTMRLDAMPKSLQPPNPMPMPNYAQMQSQQASPQRPPQQMRPLQATPQAYSNQQMAQLRMLQQQQQQQQQRYVAQSAGGQPNFNPTIQQLHQFYSATPLNHPGAMAQMHNYQSHPGMTMPQQPQQQIPPGVGPPPTPGSQRGQPRNQGQGQQDSQGQQRNPNTDERSDPLFMLK